MALEKYNFSNNGLFSISDCSPKVYKELNFNMISAKDTLNDLFNIVEYMTCNNAVHTFW